MGLRRFALRPCLPQRPHQHLPSAAPPPPRTCGRSRRTAPPSPAAPAPPPRPRAPRRGSGPSPARRRPRRDPARPPSPAATRVPGSPIASPSVKYAVNSRSFSSSCCPDVRARWRSRCASTVLPDCALSNRKSRPTAAARAVTPSNMASMSAGVPPYLRPSCSARDAVAMVGAPGSSSKLRHVTSTESPCSNSASAACRCARPMQHHGQTTSDQTSTGITFCGMRERYRGVRDRPDT